MIDRKMIKYRPFNSVVNTKTLVNDVEKNRNTQLRPILSEDDYEEIEYNLLSAINTGTNIIINFYKDGYIYIIEGKVTSLDTYKKRILLNNNIHIYFNDVIKVICL